MTIHKVHRWGTLGQARTKCGLIVGKERVALTYKGSDCKLCLKTRPKPKMVKVYTEGIV